MVRTDAAALTIRGLRQIRPLGRESLRGVEPSKIGEVPPRFEWVDPKAIYVEEAYQRDVREKGVRLVRHIYSAFSWARYKTPICVEAIVDGGNTVLVCIDGQHTTTAAASHPSIDKIPVMIVDAAALQNRASAFVGHNRDRLGLTAPVIFHAEIAAGEPLAISVQRACAAAGANVLMTSVNLRNKQPTGSTIAIGTIRSIAKKNGEAFLVRVLKVLVAAKRGPIKAAEIGAVAIILADPGSERIDDRLREVIASKTAEQWAADGAGVTSVVGGLLPGAIASLWCRELAAARLPIPAQAPARPAAPPPPRQAPRAAPKPTPIPAPPSAPSAPSSVVRNGVALDLGTGMLTHRGKTVHVARADGVAIVAALVRVMPAFLDKGRVIGKAFSCSAADGAIMLQGLLDDIKPQLRAARLEVRAVGKIGLMIADLGAE